MILYEVKPACRRPLIFNYMNGPKDLNDMNGQEIKSYGMAQHTTDAIYGQNKTTPNADWKSKQLDTSRLRLNWDKQAESERVDGNPAKTAPNTPDET